MLLIPYIQAALIFTYQVLRWAVVTITGLTLLTITIGLLLGILAGSIFTGCNATLEAVNGKPLLKKVR